MKRLTTPALCLAACLLASGLCHGQGGDKKAPLVVVDGNGKEYKLAKWEISQGTRRLSWLTPDDPAPEKQGKKGKKGNGPAGGTGPEAIEFREDNSTTFVEGILTLVPIESVKRLDYDNEAKTVTLTYLKAGPKGDEEGEIKGSTKFVGINKLTIEAEADLGDLGMAAIKFQGGAPKGVRSITFPAPKAVPAAEGRKGFVIARDKEKTKHALSDPKILYTLGGGRTKALDKLQFKATVKVPLDKIDLLRHVEDNGKGGAADFEVVLKGGMQHTLTLLKNVNPEDGSAAALQGLLVRVPAGYKLFPLHVVGELDFRSLKEARHGPGHAGDAQVQAGR
jgi:hypothetical protein